MKHDEHDIQTACDMATGDDGTTGKEVLRILKQVANEDWKMMIERIEKNDRNK